MYALADCNNFYCSCERVFNSSLEGKPVIVLSNNDGCAIARSNEAKALGIKMGANFFEIEDLTKEEITEIMQPYPATDMEAWQVANSFQEFMSFNPYDKKVLKRFES